MHPKSALGALYQIVVRKPPRGSASGSSVVQKYAYSLLYLFLILSVLTLYSQFPTYLQISNLIQSIAIFKYQINSVCLIPIIKSFPPSLYSEQLQSPILYCYRTGLYKYTLISLQMYFYWFYPLCQLYKPTYCYL